MNNRSKLRKPSFRASPSSSTALPDLQQGDESKPRLLFYSRRLSSAEGDCAQWDFRKAAPQALAGLCFPGSRSQGRFAARFNRWASDARSRDTG